MPHHEHLCIAAQAGLQQPGELGVAVGDVALAAAQRGYHVACMQPGT